MTQSLAERARSPRAARAIAEHRPFGDARARTRQNRRLAEAIRRQGEPGEWCQVGRGDLGEMLATGSGTEGSTGPWSGAELVEIGSWLWAAEETRAAWDDEAARSRFAELWEIVESLPKLDGLRKQIADSLEEDGRVSDAASPALRRARRELAEGERGLQQKLERWAGAYGESAYVTRHGDRFVALIPASGFPRRRGIVHDVSGSGQSLFVEPIEMCDANNHLIEVRATIDEEERRVLLALTEAVRESSEALLAEESGLIELDQLHAGARWATELGAIALDPAGARLRLVHARHPLLALGKRREDVVPLDLELEDPGRLLLVSGPNMGGKTVLLKTVGLCTALAHAALPVPCAEGSAVPELDELLVDVGDEQSVDQGLSTFAAHLEHLTIMVERAGPRTLVLCDELGAGTDPEEGAALGRALIEHFSAHGSWAVITTHLGSLKLLAGEVPGVVNGSLDFDMASLSPRYRFLPGVPGASHALTIAERLGLDPAIVGRARELEPRETQALERLLADLQTLRVRMDQEIQELAAAREAAEAASAESRTVSEEAKRSLAELRKRLTRESEVLLGHARELWQSMQREARRSEKTREGAQAARERVESVEREITSLNSTLESARRELGGEPEPSRTIDPAALVPGMRVRVVDLGVEAEVVASPDAEGKVRLRRGAWNINTHVDRLAPAGEGGPPANGAKRESRATAAWDLPDAAPALDVDLRGMEVEEALRTLDEGLDRGIVSGLSELRIIHGVGRGILKAAVERHLRGHPQVASQRMGELNEGGRGVTVAKMR